MVLSRLFNRVRPDRASAPAVPAVPAGQRVYAVGDIHGRDDLFAALLEHIATDDAARGPADTTLILLGDLVDRGPDSRGVVERAMGLQAGPWRLRWLVGNHEEMFLGAVRGNVRTLRQFVRWGGAATIHSYGLTGDAYAAADFEALARELPRHVPVDHLTFLAAGENSIIIGDYLFVHAGIRPGVPIAAQSVSDMRWIRDEFLNHAHGTDKVVVHGHTIAPAPEDTGSRIGIDTGAYDSGVLTAVGLEGSARWYLATAASDGRVPARVPTSVPNGAQPTGMLA